MKVLKTGAFRVKQLISRLSAMQIIVLVFLTIILLGSLLLTLPAASKSRTATPFLTALFTATSCTCVTGLSLVDTGSYWSGFGHGVMLCLIQIGGLGFMTIVTLFLRVMGRKLGLKDRLVMAQSLGLDSQSGISAMAKKIVCRTLLVEGAGALVLTIRFSLQMPVGKALWWGIFHAVSAFCNAGFDIMGQVEAGGSLSAWAGDPVLNVTLMLLIALGGLGFYVWEDVLKNRRFRRLSVYSRLVLMISLTLTIGGAVLFALLEWNNPATLGGLPAGEKLLAAAFQSVTVRTAGFYTVNQGALTGVSKALTDFLMLIGGSSGSTAGGVKTVTIGVVLLSVLATARGRSQVTVMKRTIRANQVRDAVAVVTMVFSVAFVGAMYLSVSNGMEFSDCLYETISAIATVGLTTGLTPLLNVSSKLILIVLMFFGRVGIMTISLGFLLPDRAEERYRWVDTNVMIG